MDKLKNIAIGALFIAIGIVLSVIFHSIGGPQLGRILLPLHFVVILTGLLLGEWTGFAVGLLTPLLSALTIGMPPLSPPIAIFMMPELGAYGFVAGYLSHKKVNIYFNLFVTIVAGRVVYAIGYYIMGKIVSIHLKPLIALILSFGEGIPGIIIQFLLIPPLYFALRNHIENAKR